MITRRISRKALIALGFCGLAALGTSGTQAFPTDRPQVILVARPVVAFVPAKIAFSADLRGGADDYEEFYCASVEWEWGDGTRSESASDCEPYQPGKSEIRRHFTAEHAYDIADNYQPAFRLKKGTKVVGQAKVDIEIRPGLRP